MNHALCASDVFIVGGGPAGLAAAIALRQVGYSVTVADPALPPIDKACGEGIMPNGVRALAELGVDLPPALTVPFQGIRFLEGGLGVEARFQGAVGQGVRRTVLHDLLVRRAAETGVCLGWGVRVSGIAADRVIVNGHGIRCRWIIGADGLNSSVRRWMGLPPGRERRRYGFRHHFPVAPWSEFVDVYWGDGFQIYVTPVTPQAVCVACISSDPHLRLNDALQAVPGLWGRLRHVEPISREQGSMTLSRRLPQVCRGNVALIGDASGSVDAITGEGLALGFEQALALRDALRGGALRRYQPTHRALARWPGRMARLLLAMNDHPHFRRRVLHAFTADRSLFPRLLGMHTGAGPLADLGFGGAGSLVWNFLAAPHGAPLKGRSL